MRGLLQRVRGARVEVAGEVVGAIDQGLLVLVAVEPEDSREHADKLLHKLLNYRVFSDEQGKMNLSVLDVGGAAVVVSQFTLYADTRKGHRPSFIEAAPPEQASALCDTFVEQLKGLGVPTQTGVFGAHMLLELINDGPVTIWLEM